MTTQAHLFGAAGRTDDDQTLAELEVDYTPVAVAVQLLLALDELADLNGSPGHCLCPAAGSGAFARAMRAVFGPLPVIVGVDIRESECTNLRAACDRVYIGDVMSLTTLGDFDDFGLVADNPPFTAFSTFWPGALLDGQRLAPDATVAFYGLSSWGQSAEAAAHLERWSPSLQLRVGGRIAHRGSAAADAREYSFWVWHTTGGKALDVRRRCHTRSRQAHPEWTTIQLPALPTEMRRWSPSAVPGTYPIEPALVDEIRRRYL